MFKFDEKTENRKKLICELVAEDAYVPMKEKELAAFLQVQKEDRQALREVLQEPPGGGQTAGKQAGQIQ